MADPATNTTTLLHTKPSATTTSPPTSNPLPQLLHTPAGLALLELQGTINLPIQDSGSAASINIGRLDFPDYKPDSLAFDPSSTAWMKRVYLFVGQHQRLTGEVKKLPRAMAVVGRRAAEQGSDDLEIVEVVKYKIVFSSRPEPVGTA